MALLNCTEPATSSSTMLRTAVFRTPSSAGGVPPATLLSDRLTVSVPSASVSLMIGTETVAVRTPGPKVSVRLTAV